MTRTRRILLTTDAVGGVWRYTIDLATALDDAGHACLVLGAGPEPDPSRLVECEWRNSRVLWTNHALDWTEQTDDARYAARADLERHARDWRAEILHLHSPSNAAGVARDLTVVAVAHSCHPTWWQAAGQGPMPDAWHVTRDRTRAGPSRADHVIAPTRAHAQALTAVYGPISHVSVIPNATRTPDTVVGKQPTILAAGRWWDPAKNARLLDEAARHITWPVELAGPAGPAFSPQHARLLGEEPNHRLRQRMANAAIFASPSLYEPFGLAVLEAASHRCALVLADIPSFRELWTGRALFADPRDPHAFARAIQSLIDDEPQRQRLAEAAQQAARRYTPERQRDAVLATYAQCLQVAA